MKKVTGVLDDIWCASCRAKVKMTVSGYEQLPRGALRVIGTCPKGHNASGFAKKSQIEDALKSGKLKAGAGCPYEGGLAVDDVPDFTDVSGNSEVEGSGARRKGSRKSRKSRGSRKSAHKSSRESRSRKSRGSRKSTHKSAKRSRSRSRKSAK